MLTGVEEQFAVRVAEARQHGQHFPVVAGIPSVEEVNHDIFACDAVASVKAAEAARRDRLDKFVFSRNDHESPDRDASPSCQPRRTFSSES
jgi:hypothetical protein